jgi:hypothetical protein
MKLTFIGCIYINQYSGLLSAYQSHSLSFAYIIQKFF